MAALNASIGVGHIRGGACSPVRMLQAPAAEPPSAFEIPEWVELPAGLAKTTVEKMCRALLELETNEGNATSLLVGLCQDAVPPHDCLDEHMAMVWRGKRLAGTGGQLQLLASMNGGVVVATAEEFWTVRAQFRTSVDCPFVVEGGETKHNEALKLSYFSGGVWGTKSEDGAVHVFTPRHSQCGEVIELRGWGPIAMLECKISELEARLSHEVRVRRLICLAMFMPPLALLANSFRRLFSAC